MDQWHRLIGGANRPSEFRRGEVRGQVDALVAASDGLCTAILLDNASADPRRIRDVLARALGTAADSGAADADP